MLSRNRTLLCRQARMRHGVNATRLVLATLIWLLAGCSSKAALEAAPTQNAPTQNAAAEPSASAASTPPAAMALTASQQAQQQAATVAMGEHRYQDAIVLLQTLPDDESGYLTAVAWYRLNQLDNASTQLERLLPAAPASPQAATTEYDATIRAAALNLRGLIAKQQGAFRQAERDFLAAIATAPRFAAPERNLGILYELFLANPEQAALHYKRYVELTHDSSVQRWLDTLPKTPRSGAATADDAPAGNGSVSTASEAL